MKRSIVFLTVKNYLCRNDESQEENESEQLQMTPEMVNSQFPVHNITPPPSDDKAKKE